MRGGRSADALEREIAAGPDPESGRACLERFIESGGALPSDEEGCSLLAAIFASGSFLSDTLLSDVARWPALRSDPWLGRTKPRGLMVAEVTEEVRGSTSFTDLQRRLRRLRRREMLRLGAREIAGDTMEVARELSALADACLEAAVVYCEAELRAAWGAPTSPEGDPRFVVMGMGKLGGEELNFSSDVDLIFVYSTDDGAAGSLSLHEYYAKLSQAVTRALDEITADGFVFRVDLRLRPEGRSGAICNSLPAAERYYEAFGRTWERQALLRARPCAGDQTLGNTFLRTLEPFVYPRTLGPQTVDQVRALRALYQAGAEPHGWNVKVGAGGIRDIELVAQLLQLLHAGKRPELRDRGTLSGLHKLALAGLLSDQELRALSAAYRFWRRIEHRLQLEHATQTHQVPGDPVAFGRLARRLGFPDGAGLAEAIGRHAEEVRGISATLGEPVGGPPAIVLRLLDSASSPERLISDLATAGFRDLQASADALDLARGRLPPEWLEEAVASPDPDRALAQFRDLALRGSLGLFSLLKEERPLLRMLAGLFGTSERLSRYLVSHPGTWVPMFEGLGAPRPAANHWSHALDGRLAGLDYETALREMRRFQAEEILRIGLHDVAGNLQPEEVSEQLGALAQACLQQTLRLVAEPLEARFGKPTAGLTVLALGSFGAHEMRYGSDLDLVFLYARPGSTDRGIDHQEWFARLAQRLINSLGALLDEGRLYEVDTRLRPSGQQGMLVTSYESFDRYHQEEAAPSERMALLRARPVVTHALPGEESFAATLEKIAYERPVDLAKLRADLRHVRDRIEKERGGSPDGGAVHLRFSAGGLTDLEFLAALAQIRHGATDRALRTSSPYEALVRLVAREGEDAVLLDDYRFLQRATLRLRLLRERPDDRLTAEDRPALARSMGLTEAELIEGLRTRMTRVRAVFVAAFDG